MNTLWVGIGGAVGSIARYHLGRFAAARAPGFPWGTLVVNLAGCLAMGILVQLVLRGRVHDAARLAIGVGVLGGFTTYSSFNHEMIALAQSGAWGRAAAYVGATLAGCIVLGLAGLAAGRAL